MKKHVVIGSRGSILALAQANLVKSSLEANYPDLTFEIKEIVTSGDKDLKSNWENNNASLKSFFTKEIEQELLNGQIDIAVHSMKDMPAVSPKGLICGAIPDREDARDVLISKNGFLVTLPQGAKIGTSSLRRVMNLKAIRPDFEIKHLRGNIHTRLKKLETEDYDAIILAAAGLKRTGMADKITEYLSGEAFPPAPAQGVLYIQCRENDEEIIVVNDILEDVLKQYKLLANQKNIEIKNELSTEKIYIGITALKIVLSNLINNAVKYSDEGGVINIGTKDDWLYIENSYKDNKDLDINKIFEINFSLNKENSNGLGLYIVKNILFNYGIKYKVEKSEIGIVFLIELSGNMDK